VAATGYVAQIGGYILRPQPASTTASLGVDVLIELAPGNPALKQGIGAIAGQIVPGLVPSNVNTQSQGNPGK
jgi:hypothetical protein